MRYLYPVSKSAYFPLVSSKFVPLVKVIDCVVAVIAPLRVVSAPETTLAIVTLLSLSYKW